MQEAKVALYAIFAKGNAEQSEALPDANPMVFLVWLQAKLGQFAQLLNNVLDFGAYGAAFAVVWSFQATRCDHIKRLGCINHNFPSVDNV
jgi:hypothetical protein